MRSCLSLLIACSFFISYSQQQLKIEGKTCYDVIKELAEFDLLLETRQTNKIAQARTAQDADQFIQNMCQDSVYENGTKYQCIRTRSWLSEVYVGLKHQFSEVKEDKFASTHQFYQTYYGRDVAKLFQSRRNSSSHYLYQLRHKHELYNKVDHDYVIEQLPNGEGYRVYQSYIGFYSLKAWLADDLHGLQDSGDILFNNPTYTQRLAQNLTHTSITLDHLEMLPSQYEDLYQYLEGVHQFGRNYTFHNFEVGWEKYGKGRIIPQEEFFSKNSVVYKTAKLTSYLEKIDGKSDPFKKEDWELWVDLYAAVPANVYPGIQADLLKDSESIGHPYLFQIKVVKLGSNERALNKRCVENAQIILDSILRNPETQQQVQQKIQQEQLLLKSSSQSSGTQQIIMHQQSWQQELQQPLSINQFQQKQVKAQLQSRF